MTKSANSTMKMPVATVVIATKNRKEDLTKALKSCFNQNIEIEVIVMNDGSDDGTSEMVKNDFHQARIYSFDESSGYIVRRNQGAHLASADIIISIDDDAEFSSPKIVRDIISQFTDPRIAGVAIPFIDVKYNNQIRQIAPDNKGVWLTNEFIGTAYAIKKTVFEDKGGYREYLYHQGEEGDLCIRLLNSGYLIRMGYSDPILHYESPKRSLERINMYGQRNLLLFSWYNVPFPELLPHFIMTIYKGLLWGLRNGCFRYRFKGVLIGIVAIFNQWNKRHPVSRDVYKLFRLLKKNSPVLLIDICRKLPVLSK